MSSDRVSDLKKIVLRSCPPHPGEKSDIKPTLLALQNRLGLSDAELRKVVLGSTSSFRQSYETAIEPRLTALEKILALSLPELKKIILKVPVLLSYSTEATIEPKLKFMEEELEFSKDALREVIIKTPRLLIYSLDQRYRPRLQRCRANGLPPSLVIERPTLDNDKFDLFLARKKVALQNKQPITESS